MTIQSNAYILATALGLASHWTYFIHGEHHMQAPVYGSLFLASMPTLYLLELQENGPSHALRTGLQLIAVYILALFTSMTVYRLFFHRLRHFNGPLGARISKIWHTWYVRHSRNHLVLDRLYREYGTFVRTGASMCRVQAIWYLLTMLRLGPEELTVFDPETLWAMNAPASAFRRPDWYDLPLPLKSLANVRDVAIHDQRRRIWDQAFSLKGIS